MSCMCVTLVYCGQTVGWIRMSLGTDVGLGPGDIVLDGDLRNSTPHGKGHSSPPPLFGPCVLCPNGAPSQQLLSSCYAVAYFSQYLYLQETFVSRDIQSFLRCRLYAGCNATRCFLLRFKSRNELQGVVFISLTKEFLD